MTSKETEKTTIESVVRGWEEKMSVEGEDETRKALWGGEDTIVCVGELTPKGIVMVTEEPSELDVSA